MNERQRVVSREVLERLTLDTEPWLSCDDCFERLDVYVERLLADPSYLDRPMATHLACAACAEEAQSLLDLIAGE